MDGDVGDGAIGIVGVGCFRSGGAWGDDAGVGVFVLVGGMVFGVVAGGAGVSICAVYCGIAIAFLLGVRGFLTKDD